MEKIFLSSAKKGFTLIELLVVVAIIGLLSTVIMVNVKSVRSKARDSKKIIDAREVSKALQLFYDANGRMPLNYNPCCGALEGSTYYNQSMQELVDGGFLPSIPQSSGSTGGWTLGKYAYYDYGPNNSIGALFVTSLEAAPQNATGIIPSCRPFAAYTNWCDRKYSNEYCMCNPY